MDSTSHPYVIDADAEGTADQTAVLLIGTATEFDLDPGYHVQRITRPYPGFRITEALAEVLGRETDAEVPDADDDTEPAPEPDLSGNKQSLAPEHDIHGVPTEVAYEDWDYADLKSAVSTRGIDTEDKRTETLIAALKADDLTNAVFDDLGDDSGDDSDSTTN